MGDTYVTGRVGGLIQGLPETKDDPPISEAFKFWAAEDLRDPDHIMRLEAVADAARAMREATGYSEFKQAAALLNDALDALDEGK